MKSITPSENVSPFDAAVRAIINGEAAKLEELLSAHPALVHERSTSPHHATLLHYVAANGVEDELQVSPLNGPQITRLLLEAGSEPDALAETYGGGPLQTTLNLLVSSVHPAKAETQVAILDVLVDFGAAIEGVTGDGSPLLTAIAFAYTAAADRLVERGARVDTLLAAAGTGDLKRVRSFFDGRGTLVELAPPRVPWIGALDTNREHLEHALLFASLNTRLTVMAHLLEHGVDIDSLVRGATCLHQAACRGNKPVVEFLLDHGARTNIRDAQFDGTPLGWAEHCGQLEIVDFLRFRNPQ